MLRFLQQLSGFFFYLLGLSFLVSYLLFKNTVGGAWPAWWLQVADLPLVATACVYGGTSLIRGLSEKGRTPWVIGSIVTAALVMFFLLVLTLNFWGVIPSR